MPHHTRLSQEGTKNLRIGLYLFVDDLPVFTTVACLRNVEILNRVYCFDMYGLHIVIKDGMSEQ
jgi:hypothetical protein